MTVDTLEMLKGVPNTRPNGVGTECYSMENTETAFKLNGMGTETHAKFGIKGEDAYTFAAASKLDPKDPAHNDPHTGDNRDANTAVGRGTYNDGEYSL